MKNIFKILGVFFVALIAFSCEPDEYDVPDIDKVPVYNISETGNLNTYEINVYRQNSLLTVWTSKGRITSYNTTGFTDTSDELNYMVMVTAIEKNTVTDEFGVETMETVYHAYELSADKETGSCTINITTTYADASTSTSSLSGVLIEKEIYN